MEIIKTDKENEMIYWIVGIVIVVIIVYLNFAQKDRKRPYE